MDTIFETVAYPQIVSSYSEMPLAHFKEMALAPSDVAESLLALCIELPFLRVTELHRSTTTQAKARAKYEAWVAAGKPKPGTTAFDPKTMKNAYVAVPGKSMHNAGRAIDIWLNPLQQHFGKEYLDAFWPIADEYGFSPVIAKPIEGMSESWHFDHWGPWQTVRDLRGYETGALCAALVVGEAGKWQTQVRVLQALLLRAGFDIGDVDGQAGERTNAGLALALGGIIPSSTAKILKRLRCLPASKIWKNVVG